MKKEPVTVHRRSHYGTRLWLRQRWAAGWGWTVLLSRKHWSTIAGTVFACTTVLGFQFKVLTAPVAAAVLAVLGIVPLIRDWLGVRDNVRDFYKVEHRVPDVVDEGGWQLVQHTEGRIVVNSAVNGALRRPVVLDRRQYVLPPDLAAIKSSVIAVARSERSRAASQPFDGLNVRLCDDLDRGDTAVRLQIMRYFDLLASNYLAGYQWRSRRLGRTVADINRRVVSESGRLVPLKASDLANQVGVSTVALTQDSRMLLVMQGAAARSSAGLVAPSGSGSLEPEDLAGSTDLSGVVAAGMERELREELGLTTSSMREVATETTVLGFGRWLEKGAKPEFFGFTRIRADLQDLDLRIDLSERQFVNEHLRLSREEVLRLMGGTPFAELGYGVPSVPLEACLDLMRERRMLTRC